MAVTTTCPKKKVRRQPKSLGRIDVDLWDRFRNQARANGRYVYAYLEEALEEKLAREKEC